MRIFDVVLRVEAPDFGSAADFGAGLIADRPEESREFRDDPAHVKILGLDVKPAEGGK